MNEIFKRYEKKYILTNAQREMLLNKIGEHLVPDEYGPSTICNIYFDTNDHDLIRESMDKPFYKEKVRMRSYNTPGKDSNVFLEIKKKYDGVVYKRRITSSLHNIEDYVNNGINFDCNEQIKKEIDYCFKYYDLKPALFLAYDRVAFYDRDNKDFRVTFDTNIVSRDYDLKLESGVYGERFLKDDHYVMEVKCISGYPMWFVNILNELKIYPHSYSKYGTIYQESFEKEHDEFKYQKIETKNEVEKNTLSSGVIRKNVKAIA